MVSLELDTFAGRALLALAKKLRARRSGDTISHCARFDAKDALKEWRACGSIDGA